MGIDDGRRNKVIGKDMDTFACINNAFLVLEKDKIASFGRMEDLDIGIPITIGGSIASHIDATGKFVIPSFCDSHTHLVYASSREQEFVDRINGLTYQQVAERGGGILNSAKKIKEASEEELVLSAWKRLDEIMMLGTGAVEIKSGYGLNIEG